MEFNDILLSLSSAAAPPVAKNNRQDLKVGMAFEPVYVYRMLNQIKSSLSVRVRTYSNLFFFLGLLPSGVATVNHPFNLSSASSSLTPTNFMSSFTTSVCKSPIKSFSRPPAWQLQSHHPPSDIFTLSHSVNVQTISVWLLWLFLQTFNICCLVINHTHS